MSGRQPESHQQVDADFQQSEKPPRVISRSFLRDPHGSVIDWFDETSTFERAEQIAGVRLDRRGRYLISDHEVRRLSRWSSECSGCNGSGCHECGYKGNRQHGTYLPLWVFGGAE